MTVMALESMLTPETESTLVRAQTGDEASFEDLVQAHESMVFSIAFHSIRNDAVAEEIAQEVFLKLFRHLGSIESEQHLANWLRRTTSNQVIDYVRKHKLTLIELEEVHEAPSPVQENDPWLAARLRNLLRELPVRQRLVVTLRYQEEMAPREIAQVLRMPINTVRSHLRRALSVLRASLSTSQGNDKS